eukprot:364168-Chlamydomonas_euryale.AAC.4
MSACLLPHPLHSCQVAQPRALHHEGHAFLLVLLAAGVAGTRRRQRRNDDAPPPGGTGGSGSGDSSRVAVAQPLVARCAQRAQRAVAAGFGVRGHRPRPAPRRHRAARALIPPPRSRGRVRRHRERRGAARSEEGAVAVSSWGLPPAYYKLRPTVPRLFFARVADCCMSTLRLPLRTSSFASHPVCEDPVRIPRRQLDRAGDQAQA